MNDFRVSTEIHPPFTVINVYGELDIATEPELRRRVEGVLDHPTARLLFDLSDVEFLDSTGLQIIFDTYVRLGRGHRVAVCGLSPRVKKVFDALGLSDEIDIYADCVDAFSHPDAGLS